MPRTCLSVLLLVAGIMAPGCCMTPCGGPCGGGGMCMTPAVSFCWPESYGACVNSCPPSYAANSCYGGGCGCGCDTGGGYGHAPSPVGCSCDGSGGGMINGGYPVPPAAPAGMQPVPVTQFDSQAGPRQASPQYAPNQYFPPVSNGGIVRAGYAAPVNGSRMISR